MKWKKYLNALKFNLFGIFEKNVFVQFLLKLPGKLGLRQFLPSKGGSESKKDQSINDMYPENHNTKTFIGER